MDAARAMPNHAELLAMGAAQLRGAGIETARLDAEVLLARAMDTDRAGLYAHLHAPSSDEVERRFAILVDRRARREPVAYLTGVQEFWSLPFVVNPSVLIPRPETELLVEVVGRLGRAAPVSSICDIGTGSGCIAVALARELPSARIVAIDVSTAALAVAAHNAVIHGVADRIAFAHGDLFDPLDPDTRFDVIVSNPPYLSPDDRVTPELAFEPPPALAGGADGLVVIRRLIAAAPPRLRAGGWLVMELGCGHAAAACASARAVGFVDVDVEPDLAGIPRALAARWPGRGR